MSRNAMMPMAALFFRTVVRTRRSLIAGLLVLAAAAVSIIAGLAGGSDPASRQELLRAGMFFGPLGFLVQFGGLFYGLAVVQEELEGGTAVYIFTRALDRRQVFLGRYLAAAGVLFILMIAYTLLMTLISHPPAPVQHFFAATLSCLLGITAYLGVFTLLAVWVKNSMAIGMVYLIGWELAVSSIPFPIRNLTLKYHLLSIYNQLALAADFPITNPKEVLSRYDGSLATGILAILAVAGVTVFLSAKSFANKDV